MKSKDKVILTPAVMRPTPMLWPVAQEFQRGISGMQDDLFRLWSVSTFSESAAEGSHGRAVLFGIWWSLQKASLNWSMVLRGRRYCCVKRLRLAWWRHAAVIGGDFLFLITSRYRHRIIGRPCSVRPL